nr:hypothetical protein [Ligilactobacillus ruminis]
MHCCSTNVAKISFEFTDNEPFLADLSVSKTHFTDKRPIFIDVSVNGSAFCKMQRPFNQRVEL